jgi:membrane-associated phospholipid phosphatase
MDVKEPWQSLWNRQVSFLLPFAGFLIVAGAMLLAFTKTEIHLAIDAHHLGLADRLFPWVTLLGEGWTVVALVLLLLFVRYRYALMVAASSILAALCAQLLKHTLFAGAARPKEFFSGIHELHLIPGVDLLSYNSFPSGHAATAFAACFCLAMFSGSRTVKAALFCSALVIAFSRVYLSQHFLLDIYAGAVIGVLSAAATSLCLDSTDIPLRPGGLDGSLVRRTRSLPDARSGGRVV